MYSGYSLLRRLILLHWPLLARGWGIVSEWLKFHLDHDRRKYLQDNLSAAFPEKTNRQIHRLACRVALAVQRNRVDQRRLEIMTDAEIDRTVAGVEICGRSHFEELYRAGRPIILVTPHYGSYMLGARCVAAAFPKNGLYFFYNPPERNSYAESSNRLLERPNSGCHKIYNNSHGIKTALKALRGGGVLCMMPDLISVTTSSLYVPFFGRFFTAMAGIAFLALRSNAAVVPAYCFPKESLRGKTILEFRPPLELGTDLSQDLNERVYRLTCALFQDLERQIRTRPEHWKYWHVFLKRSLVFPRPALSKEGLLQQLRDEKMRDLTSEDAELQAVIRDWTVSLDERGPGKAH
jgi:KDO2-lipid IV(A) lauroyltransferase